MFMIILVLLYFVFIFLYLYVNSKSGSFDPLLLLWCLIRYMGYSKYLRVNHFEGLNACIHGVEEVINGTVSKI